ncbi:MAG: hypothetical protein AAEJ52_02490 [Myxococcota bacterium]
MAANTLLILGKRPAEAGHFEDCRKLAQPQTRAVIFAAGRGSGIETTTSDHPKCLLAVRGLILIEHQLAAISTTGAGTASIVAGYCVDQVRESVVGSVQRGPIPAASPPCIA